MLSARLPAQLRRSQGWLSTRPAARCFGSLADALQRPGTKVHAFVSRSRDPVINLSIEHYLLQKSAHDSTILFLYTNGPCVVIGRNQNPWLEVDLGLLGQGAVSLVRRRSGGGTVFHDEGNVNWSVISPPAQFTRDKHAEMVVRALRGMNVERARVNERHDIVLDQGPPTTTAPVADTHRTAFTVDDPAGPLPLKVSGSAYKLVRGRALHHGTCLLSSPNLNIISHYLHSPAKPFIKAYGVESVSSPVANIGLPNHGFIQAVQREFAYMYGSSSAGPAAIEIGDEQLHIPELRKGYDEMKTLDWTYLQTPKFTFSVPTSDQALPARLPTSTRISLSIHNGAIHEGHISNGDNLELTSCDTLRGLKLHEIHDWNPLLQQGVGRDRSSRLIADWLRETLPDPRSQ